MVANILKYGNADLIILYYYTYSKLLGTMKIVVQNSIVVATTYHKDK